MRKIAEGMTVPARIEAVSRQISSQLSLALVSILANTLVIAVHALDGSAEADRLDALGRAIHQPLARRHHLREQAEIPDQPIAVIGRKAERVAIEGITAAGAELAVTDRIIDAGRAAYQGTGPLSEPAANPNDTDGVIGYRHTDTKPQVDERPVHLALDQVHTPLTGEQPGNEQAAA